MEYRLSAHSADKGDIKLETGYIFLDKDAAIEAYEKARCLVEEEQGLSMNIRNIWEQRPMYDIIRSEKIECENQDVITITLIEVERPATTRNMRYVVLYDTETEHDDFIFLFEVGMSLLKGSEIRSELFMALLTRLNGLADLTKDPYKPDTIDNALDELAYKGIASFGNRFTISTEDIPGYVFKDAKES